VFWNLIKNAVKFTPDGGRVGVRTWNDSPERRVRRNRDSGAGIEPSVLPRIFNAFDQGEQTITRSSAGWDWGWRSPSALADLHGGTIRAESEGKGCGRGSRSSCPRARPSNASSTRSSRSPARRDDTPRSRILLVEDHLDTQRTLAAAARAPRLRRRHRRQRRRRDGRPSVARVARRAGVDLIISDIGLPDATGYDLIRQVRATPAIAHLPAIAVSGFGIARRSGPHVQLRGTLGFSIFILQRSLSRMRNRSLVALHAARWTQGAIRTRSAWQGCHFRSLDLPRDDNFRPLCGCAKESQGHAELACRRQNLVGF
jgi:CheY-like chemotaxis protein